MADSTILDNSALTTERIINATRGIQTFSSANDSSYSLGPGDTDDYFKLTVSRSSNVIIKLNPVGGNANISLLSASGDPNSPVVASMNNPGTLADAIVTDPSAPLQPGQTYYIRVSATNPTTNIDYTLSVEALPTSRADFVLRNYGVQAGGLTGIWYMDGTQIASSQYLNPSFTDPSWIMYGVGNFDGTGNPNYIWRNPSLGLNGLWFMDSTGANLQGTTLLYSFFGDGWYVPGTGDFNGDGNQDMLWTNTADGASPIVWFMNGATATASALVDALQDPGWRVEGVGDFNGDGKPDLWQRNVNSGENLLWLMNGTQFQSQIGNLPSLDASFDVRGVGDFNGDGKTDVVFRNRVTGQVDVWFMDRTTFLSSATIASSMDPSWDISAVVSSTPKVNLAGSNAATAFNIGKLDATANYNNVLNPSANDYYSFTLDAQSRVSVTTAGTGLAVSSRIQIETADGTVLGTSAADGTNGQKISDQPLEAGTYFVRVISSGTTALNYNISIGAAPQLPVNLFFPSTPAPLQLTTLAGANITPTTALSVLTPYTLNANYNIQYTGRPLTSFKLSFFLSTSASGTANDYRFDLNNDSLSNASDFITITNRAPDTVISGTTQLTLPSKESPFWTQDGTYFIRVVLDPENEIPEANLQNVPTEDDNQASVQIRVRDARLPDLRPDDFSVTGGGTRGSQISVSGAVSNIGTAASDTGNPVGSTFGVRFYLSTDNSVSGADFSLGTFTLSPVTAGSTASFNRTFTLPTNWVGYSQSANNQYYLIEVVDPNLTVNELTGGRANNTTSRLISIV
jgi:hypothetical protein